MKIESNQMVSRELVLGGLNNMNVRVYVRCAPEVNHTIGSFDSPDIPHAIVSKILLLVEGES